MDYALEKVDRAAKHVAQLAELLRESRPFRYIFETNEKTGECSTYVERDETIISDVMDIAYDATQKLRTALDYAYWDIVSPFATNERERKKVQFPFSETGARLKEGVENRLAHRVSDAFFKSVMTLRPHGEPGGNELLWAVHGLSAPGRHRFPTPIADYKEFTGAALRKLVPSFPRMFDNTHLGLGGNGRDIVWRIDPLPFLDGEFIFKREIDIPVEVVFKVGTPKNLREMVPALNAMVDKTKEAIQIIRSA